MAPPSLPPGSQAASPSPVTRVPAVITDKLKVARRAQDLACKLKHNKFPHLADWRRPWRALFADILASQHSQLSEIVCRRTVGASPRAPSLDIKLPSP
eukprot:319869-Alexandrium_andersonii.AAC.1